MNSAHCRQPRMCFFQCQEWREWEVEAELDEANARLDLIFLIFGEWNWLIWFPICELLLIFEKVARDKILTIFTVELWPSPWKPKSSSKSSFSAFRMLVSGGVPQVSTAFVYVYWKNIYIYRYILTLWICWTITHLTNLVGCNSPIFRDREEKSTLPHETSNTRNK